ncbi:MAG: hypothetical protein K0Q72_1253 [Armatimonadetes bacterium]|jgi:hypothetical protein|nr:hypothetical protein [Armatimonadota bacterium]
MWTYNRDGELINLAQALKIETSRDEAQVGGVEGNYCLFALFPVVEEQQLDVELTPEDTAQSPRWRGRAIGQSAYYVDILWGTYSTWEAVVAAQENLGRRLGVLDPAELGAEPVPDPEPVPAAVPEA